MANSFLSRTPGSTTDAQRKQFTISMWVKRSTLLTGSSHQELVSTNATDQFGFRFQGDNKLDIFDYSVSGNNYPLRLVTNRLFRDTSAWYNIILQVDTPNATSSNRVKLWVNGVQETSFGTATYPSQDYVTTWNKNGLHQIGSKAWGNSGNGQNFFDGYISHLSNVAGSVVAPTVFGQTDSTSGIWKFKSPSGITWGNNGFHLKFENSAALGTDSSGNTNTFTVNGNLKQALDTPSNVYATINQLFSNDDGDANALTDGNNTYTSTNRSEWNNMAMTLGASTGKWYWEVKYTQLIDASTIYMADEGVASTDLAAANLNLGEGSRSGYGYGWLCANRNTTSNTRYLKTVNGTATITTDSNNTPVSAGDIVGIAWDATNGKLWFHKNGTYIDDLSGNVGNPSSGAYPYHTGMQTGIMYTPWADVWQNSSGSLLIKSYNFGNGFFGTTAITSAGSNGNGSLFEYDVPSGYYALNTKNINTYG
jgi:hypothetical protein